MPYVHVSLGSNLGDRLVNLAAALVRIEMLPETVVLRLSHVYETEPWPDPDQPRYANAVALLDTSLPLDDLLDAFQDIEVELGREPGGRNAPRPIDIDILLAEDEEWESERLTVPHPRLAERDFVVTPLLEISPEAEWPGGKPITRGAVRVGRVVGVLGRVPGFEDRGPAEDPALLARGPRAQAERARQPMPGEEWAPVYEYGCDPTAFGPLPTATGAWPALTARNPAPQAAFLQLVLEQAGIPHAWDPFPPEAASDPYGFQRRFRLMVPASMAEDAIRLLSDAEDAPIQWDDQDSFGR